MKKMERWKNSLAATDEVVADLLGSMGCTRYSCARRRRAHVDDACCWKHSRVPQHLLCRFRRREDHQIMGLELLGIALGLTTFASQLKHRKLVIHCDNTGAEVAISFPVVACACSRVVQVAVRKGTERAHDHAQLCHEQWLQLANPRAHAWVVRVGTDYNVADLPSREACRIASCAAASSAVACRNFTS